VRRFLESGIETLHNVFLSPTGANSSAGSFSHGRTLRVGIAGLGTVGAAVVRTIEEQARTLHARSGRGIRVVAVTARSKAKKRTLDLRASTGSTAPWRSPTIPHRLLRRTDGRFRRTGVVGDRSALKNGKWW